MAEQKKGILLESGTNEVEFLRISVGAEQFGINVGKVCQIVVFDKQQLSTPPQGGESFVGFSYFREKPIPVYSLRSMLGIPDAPEGSLKELLLVCEFNKRTIGYVIDQVHGIHRLTWDDFCPIEEVGIANSGAVVGTVTIAEQVVMILDLEAMMGKIDPSMGVEGFEAEIEAKSEQGIDRSTLRVLYCEDSSIVQKVLIRALQKGGFAKFEVFGTGRAGLDWIQSHDASEVDVIISDIEMPAMDGLTLCKEVRALPGWSKKPFIVFSSMINDQMKEKCRSVGADAAFSKPEAHSIVAAIDDLIRAKSAT